MHANGAASNADLHLKMCKKVAQLTKVIFQLNTRNEDYQIETEHTRAAHSAEIDQLTQNAADQMRVLKRELETQVTTAAQRERHYLADRQKVVKETREIQRQMQKERAAAQEAFQTKVTELESQVQMAHQAFSQRIEEFSRQDKERAVRVQQETETFEMRLSELKMKHVDEVEKLVMTKDEKYDKMLSEHGQMQVEWEKHKQEMVAMHEGELLTQNVAAKTAFDEMKHELMTKIETLEIEVEKLETNCRIEKETRENCQEKADETIKQLEQQLVQTQQETQNVRQDASIYSDELRQKLALSTNKTNELVQELETLKQTLETQHRVLEQAQKDLETSQLEILQQSAHASELEAQFRQQLVEQEMKLTHGKHEVSLVSQQLQAGQKQIQKLEAELGKAEKSIADLHTEHEKLRQELERTQAKGEQAKSEYGQALTLLKERHENELQELKRSHTNEMEVQRVATGKQLEELEKRMTEASDENLMTLKREHEHILNEHESHSKAAETKFRDEVTRMEIQVQNLHDEIVAQSQKYAELEKQHTEAREQLESSQQHVTSLQSDQAALQSSTVTRQKERDEAHQEELRKIETQRENEISALKTAMTQQEEQHAYALLQLSQEHQTKIELLETHKLKELSTQETALRTWYEPQLARFQQDVQNLERGLTIAKEKAFETRRWMEETRSFELEQLRSRIVRFVEHTAAERAENELASRQALEELQLQSYQHEQELTKRLLDESRTQLATLQEKADLNVERLSVDHRRELEKAAENHADALQKLQNTMQRTQDQAVSNEKEAAAKALVNLSLQKDTERREALEAAQSAHDQEYEELRGQMETTQEALATKTLDWTNAMREEQSLRTALAAKTEEMASKVAELENSFREQVDKLKFATKCEMDQLVEENAADTEQLRNEFEETQRLLSEKIENLTVSLAEWQEKYARRESRPDDVARIVELERLVLEKEALARRTLNELAKFKRELLNREEMYNKTFARAPNVGLLQVLKPSMPTPSMTRKPVGQPGDLPRRRNKRAWLQSESAVSSKALPPLHNNQMS